MRNFSDWSKLPDDLLISIAIHLHSIVELLRFRSICKPWRSAVATTKKRPCSRKRILSPFNEKKCILSPAAFFRVILSSYPNEGWLVKTRLDVSEFGKKQLISPLSRVPIKSSDQTIDLLDYTVSEIHQSYDIRYLKYSNDITRCNFARVVLVEDLVLALDRKKIWCCKIGEQEVWTKIENEEVGFFLDIVVHKCQIYALDLNGAIWWISKSELNVFQFAPPTPMDKYNIDFCKDKRFVECHGNLYIVHRFCKVFPINKVSVEMTIDFKIYKMDDELVEWVEIKCLGDKAFVMAADSCFFVSASEYYGCLENSIYFTDEEEKNNVKVFKLGGDDGTGSITKMEKTLYQNCFQMFFPPFV